MQTVTKNWLSRQYGTHATTVLKDRLQALPTEKGKQAKYTVLVPLPTKEEYKGLLAKRFTVNITELVSDAFSEFNGLADELQEWYDNLPESFQNGEKGETLQSASDILQSLQEPTVPDFLSGVQTVFVPSKANSRPQRCAEAVRMLEEVIEKLSDETDTENYTAPQKEEMEDLINELTEAAGEAEGVEFPSMYG
jgi:hypothetical protein